MRDCTACLTSDMLQVTVPTPVTPVETEGVPWLKVASGPFNILGGVSKYCFVLIDYLTKWVEITFVDNITTTSVIRFL